MTDQPFYAPGRKLPARQPRPGEVVWTLHQGVRSCRAELRDHGEYGVECQVFEDDAFLYGQRCPSRDLARHLAEMERERRERDGWKAPDGGEAADRGQR